MSIGLILVIILVIFLLGGFSGRFGGYGYGFGHGGIGVIGIILIVLVVLLLWVDFDLTGVVRMSRLRLHPENHFVGRVGWLRAAVLGANDGIISTASLIVGVAAAAANQNEVLIAGVAGLVAGAMSMAAGEYVSVSSQSDTEQADLARERKELSENPEFELDELTQIYVNRGVDQALARQVAEQLMAKDALTAHAHDELGISEISTARPVQAALTSALTFSVGAAMPLLMVVVSPANALVPVVSAASLGFLALLGAIGARAGGANILRATARVTFWGALAMALTAGIGKLFGAAV